MSGLDDLLEERDRAARRAEAADLDGDESAAWRALDDVDDLDTEILRRADAAEAERGRREAMSALAALLGLDDDTPVGGTR